jgi:FkbM family methyltransferase
VLLGKYMAPRGRVIGFEPDPVAFRQCVINLNLNEVANVHVLPLAISNSVSEISLYTNRIFGNSGSTILDTNPTTQGYERGMVKVPCTTLDRMVQTLGLKPTTLKMDIEGAEDMALEGGRETIAQPGLKLLLEIHHVYLEKRGKNANTILRWLADAGKQIFFLENGGEYPYRLMEKMDPARPIDVPIFHVLAHA